MFKIKLSSSSSSSSSFSLKIILIKINDDDDFRIFMHLQCKLTFLPDILELSTIKLQNYFMIFSKTAIKCDEGNAMKQKSENLLRQVSIKLLFTRTVLMYSVHVCLGSSRIRFKCRRPWLSDIVWH